MKRLLLGLSVVGALALAAVPVGSRLLTDRTLAPIESGALTDAEVERFLADAKRIAALGVFPDGGTRDAGPLLNKWVTVDGGPDTDRGPDEPPPWKDLDLNAVQCPKVDRAATAPSNPPASAAPAPTPTDWPACVPTAPAADLTWMAALPAYDTWDPGASGPWARALAADPDAFVLAAPVPNYIPFLAAARARLVQARERGDLPAALRETRALARLLWSTEGLIAAHVAIGILSSERQAYEDGVARGVDVGTQPPVSEADSDALKRYVGALVLVYAGYAPDGTLARLAREVPDFPGRCGAIAEAIAHRVVLRDVFDGRWPGELDHRARLAGLDAAVNDGRCRLHHVGPAWRRETAAGSLASLARADGPAEGGGLESTLAHVPWVRQAVFAPIAAATAGNFNRYRE